VELSKELVILAIHKGVRSKTRRQSFCAIKASIHEVRMAYFLLALKYYIGNKKNVRRFRYFNCSSEELIAHYVTPYNNNMPFLVSGKKVMSSQIEQFLIFSSPSLINPETLLSTGTKISEEKHDVMINCLLKGELNLVEVTPELLHPIEDKKPKSEINPKVQ
jgi:hypothetical protein